MKNYTVVSGDTLWGIAKKFSLTVEQLKKLNNLTSDTLKIGQVLIISADSSNVTSYKNYTVVSGDTLWGIAKKYGMTVANLKSINNLTSDTLKIGQVLKVVSTSTGDDSGQDSGNVTTYKNYTVVSGDTLWGIAKKYGMTVANLKSINNLTSDTLKIGQILKVVSTSTGDDSGQDSGNVTTYKNYTVVSGDTLWGIAKKYGMTVANLKSINNLTSDTLKIGQVLKVASTSTGDDSGQGSGQDSGQDSAPKNYTVDHKNCDISLQAALDIQMTKSPQIQHVSWVDATRSEVLGFLDPNNHCTGTDLYQFLDLSASSNLSVEELNNFLSNKGILAGMAKVYIEAANTYHISEIYLAAHSSLETGNGTSTLATGVVVDGKTVYNMYGIGAVDSNPVGGGSKMAYDHGWTTPEKAIYGGAEWIASNYINNSYPQNTLYKMRWNPNSTGAHQYATDVHWAIAQTKSYKSLFDNFPDALLHFEIPVYR